MCLTTPLTVLFAILIAAAFGVTVVALATPGWAIVEVKSANGTIDETVMKGLFNIICPDIWKHNCSLDGLVG